MGRWLLALVVVGGVGAAVVYREGTPAGSTPGAPLDGADIPEAAISRSVYVGDELARQNLLAQLAINPLQSFPASLSWAASYHIGSHGLYPLEFLLNYQPAIFFEMCLERYKENVHGYSATFLKQECIEGKPGEMHDPEKIEIHFRDQPFSVYMNWLEGARKAKKALYVKGENEDKLLARPFGLFAFTGIWTKEVDDVDAKSTSRYTINQFGLYLATQRSLSSMRKAEQRHALHIEYVGLFKVPQTGDRLCHKFVRAPYDPPEEDGVSEITLYFDEETWLQVGTVLKDAKGKLIGEYFFRDVRINPEFGAKQFKRETL